MTSKEYFKNLTIIHLALLIGQVLFLSVVIYLNFFSENKQNPEKNEMLIYIIPVVAVVALFCSFFIEKQRLKSLINLSELRQKCDGYMSLHVTKLACIEGPSLFAIVGLMLTQNGYLLIVIAVLLAAFIYHWPTKEKLIKQLQLTYQEQTEVYSDDSVIAKKRESQF